MWLCTGFLEVRGHGESWAVSEEQVVGERLKKLQPDGFGQPNPHVLIDRFV